LRPYLAFRLATIAGDSWRPSRSQGLPGAMCIRTKVMVTTKKSTGTSQRIRRAM